MTKYQYDNKTMKAICIHCNKEYGEHKKELECPNSHSEGV